MRRCHKENVDQFLRSLNSKLREPIEQLRLVQKKCDSVKEEYEKELKLLNAKYKKRYDPVYDHRANIIRGRMRGDVFAVPGFWLKVFLSSAVVGSTINEADEEVLNFLFDVRSEPVAADRNGFSLVFKFEINPFFSIRELRKTYLLGEDDSLLVASRGCAIDWTPNRNPKFQTIWKKGKQTIRETESFFDFFDPPELPGNEGTAQLDLEQIHNIQEAIEEDFDIGLVIKDMLIPNAVSWFTGELVEDSSSDDGSSVDDSSSEEDTKARRRSCN